MSRGGAPDVLNHRHVIAAHMVVQGKSAREIAAKLGYNLNRVYLIKRSPAFQATVAEIRAEVEERLLDQAVDLHAAFDAEAPYALQTLKELHRDRSKNESVRRQAAVDILERAPSAPKRRLDKPVDRELQIHLPPNRLQDMVTTLVEIGEFKLLEKMPPEWRPANLRELIEAHRHKTKHGE